MVEGWETEGGGTMKQQKIEFVDTSESESMVFTAFPHWQVLSITPQILSRTSAITQRVTSWAVLMEQTS